MQEPMLLLKIQLLSPADILEQTHVVDQSGCCSLPRTDHPNFPALVVQIKKGKENLNSLVSE